jgi:hypothetical protein
VSQQKTREGTNSDTKQATRNGSAPVGYGALAVATWAMPNLPGSSGSLAGDEGYPLDWVDVAIGVADAGDPLTATKAVVWPPETGVGGIGGLVSGPLEVAAHAARSWTT